MRLFLIFIIGALFVTLTGCTTKESCEAEGGAWDSSDQTCLIESGVEG